VADDESNKAISICGASSFAYAGLAFLPNKAGRRVKRDATSLQIGPDRIEDGKFVNTGQWALEKLGEHKVRNGDRAAAALHYECDHVFRHVEYYLRLHGKSGVDPRLVFLGVGWAIPALDRKLGPVPHVWRVSNFYSGSKLYPQKPQRTFDRFFWWLPPDIPSWVTCVGVDLGDDFQRGVNRQVASLVSQGAEAGDVMKYLVRVLLNVADSHPTVGKSLLITHIPKGVVGSGFQGIL
jgi:hypothetical protein